MADGDNVLDLKVYTNPKPDGEPPNNEEADSMIAFLRAQADEIEQEQEKGQGQIRALLLVCRDNDAGNHDLTCASQSASAFEAIGLAEMAKTLLLNGDV